MGLANTKLHTDIILTNQLKSQYHPIRKLNIATVRQIYNFLTQSANNNYITHALAENALKRAGIHQSKVIVVGFIREIGKFKRPLINLFEFVTGLVIFCKARQSEKVRFIFALFDFDNSQTITIAEMVILVQSVLRSLQVLTDAKAPSLNQTERIVYQLFREIDTNPDRNITVDEMRDYARLDPEILGMFQLNNPKKKPQRAPEAVFENLHKMVKTVSLPRLKLGSPRSPLTQLQSPVNGPKLKNANTPTPTNQTESVGHLKRTSIRKLPSLLSQTPHLRRKSKNRRESSRNFFEINDDIKRTIENVYHEVLEKAGMVCLRTLVTTLCERKLAKDRLSVAQTWGNKNMTVEQAVQQLTPYSSYIAKTPANLQNGSKTLSERKLREYADMFMQCDIDESSTVNQFELKRRFSRLHFSIDMLFKKHKVTSRTELDFAKFLELILPNSYKINEEAVNAFFDDFKARRII